MSRLVRVVVFVLVAPFAWLLDRVDVWIGRYRFDRACNACRAAQRGPVRSWYIVRCVRCGHSWDEDDPESEVCACIDTYGSRQVEVISAGASNA